MGNLQNCPGGSALSVRYCSLGTTILLTVFLFSSFFVNVMAQVAPVNPPSKFYINGKLKADSADVGDWVDGAGSGSYVFNNDGSTSVANSTNSKLLNDPYNSASDLIFSGSAFNDNPNTWKWSAGNALNKGEINRGMYHVTSNPVAPFDKWIIMGGDRLSTSGTSYIDFEFLQKNLTRNTNNDRFTSLGTDSGRTVNDFVLSMEYVNGGVKANVHFYRWEKVGTKFQYVDRTQLIINNPTWAFAATNTITVDVPFSAFGSSTYTKSMFVEGAVNISKILSALDPCLGLSIKTIFIKTKASDAINAALKDFVEPQQVDFQFGSATLSYPDNGKYCLTNRTVLPTIEGIQGGTFSATPVGLSITQNTGAINIGSSAAGTYTITYSFNSGGGCQTPVTTKVTIYPNPTVTVNSPVRCSNGPDATFTATPGAAGTYTYTWQVPSGAANPGNAGTFNSDDAGTYTVTITDVNGCSNFNSGVLTVNQAPTVTVNNSSRCSNGPAAAITATPDPAGSYSYVWQVPPGATDPGDVSTFPATVAGTYTVTVTDVNTCSNSASGILIVNAAPTVNVANAVRCSNGPAATITATPNPAGNYTYAWQVPDGASDPGNAGTFSATVAGTYTVTVTDGNSCSNSGSGALIVNEAPSVTVNSPARCSNGPATTITATPNPAGSYTYVWQVPAEATNPGNVGTFSATITGTYTVTITDGNTCSKTGSGVLTVNLAPVCGISGSDDLVCPGSADHIYSASVAGLSYSWSISGAGTISGTTHNQSVSVTATNACNSSYTLTLSVTNPATGCSETCTKEVIVKDITNPTITCPDAVEVECMSLVPAAATNYAGFVEAGGSASDNCNGPVTITFVGDELSGTCPKTITRTYRATDACNNSATCTQTITVSDKTAPQITTCPPTISAKCSSSIPAIPDGVVSGATFTAQGGVATDNCGTFTVTKTDYSVNSNCRIYINRVWRVTDGCGNFTECVQVLNIYDDVLPEITCPANTTYTESSLPATTGTATATDNCGTVTVTYTDVLTSSGYANKPNIKRVWVATDASGNAKTCEQTITYAPPALVQSRIMTRETSKSSKETSATSKTSKPLAVKASALQVKAFPNPYNNEINFQFVSPTTGKASLTVYDLLGRKLAVVYEANVSAGISYSVAYKVPYLKRTSMIFNLKVGEHSQNGMLLHGEVSR